MAGLADVSLIEAAERVGSGQATSLELLRACWANLDAVNPRINAVIWQERDQAEAAARAADDAVRQGRTRGLLHGVPMAHKDMYYQAGKLSTCGSALRRDFRPSVTATVMQRLAAAGAYTFAGLNMAEFAQNPTGHNKTFGDCHNPWNLPYVTGGSSSGSGASVAARFNYMALGSDTGGSVRLPASACGVTGLKPTQTRVSRYGVMPLSFSHDNVGPLARTARDCARVLTVIAGHDPLDPTSSREPVPRYEDSIDGDLRGLRVGVVSNVFLDGADQAVVAAMEAALLVLSGRGASVRRIELPLLDAVAAYGGIVSRVEAAPIHGRMDAIRSAGLRRPHQRTHVSRICHPRRLLRRGAQPSRSGLESLRRRGVLQGRRSDHPNHPHLPADATGNRHRPRTARNRAQVHGAVGQYKAVQLPRSAGDQRALRTGSEWLSHRAADRRPPVRRGPHPQRQPTPTSKTPIGIALGRQS